MTSGNRKRLGEFLILLIYLIVESYGLWDVRWPFPHVWAFSAGVAGFVALLFLDGEFSGRRIAWYGVVATALCIIVYLMIPMPFPVLQPVALPPLPSRGWLEPANEPTPPNACEKAVTGDSKITILLGESAFSSDTKGDDVVPVLTPCDWMTIRFSPNGIQLTTNIYDIYGNILGRIVDNGFNIPKTEHSPIIDRDLHTLAVHDATGAELLFVHYLNEHTIRLRGIFVCPQAHQTIVIDNESVGSVQGTFCAHGAGIGVVFWPCRHSPAIPSGAMVVCTDSK